MLEQILNDGIEPIKEILDSINTNGEKFKTAAGYSSYVNAYVHWYKDSGNKLILAEQAALIPNVSAENKLERLAKDTDEYRDASNKYKQALQIKEFLTSYLSGVKIDHEAGLANTYKATAELKQNIYSTGQ